MCSLLCVAPLWNFHCDSMESLNRAQNREHLTKAGSFFECQHASATEPCLCGPGALELGPPANSGQEMSGRVLFPLRCSYVCLGPATKSMLLEAKPCAPEAYASICFAACRCHKPRSRAWGAVSLTGEAGRAVGLGPLG